MHIYPAPFFQDKRSRIDPRLAFILMPFSHPWSSPMYASLERALQREGFRSIRADATYGRVVLTDIWEQINAAGLVIAVLTGANPNVYYELGIAHCLGKEVISLLRRGDDIPFDQQPFRLLTYDDTTSGYASLERELPHWIASSLYRSTPEVLIKNERVEAFNSWRDDRTSTTRLLFRSEDFSTLNLTNINFNHVNASELSFVDCRLDGARLTNAILIRCDFASARCAKCDFRRANVSESDFTQADLTGADLREAILLRVNLAGATLAGAKVAGATIDYATYGRNEDRFRGVHELDQLVVER